MELFNRFYQSDIQRLQTIHPDYRTGRFERLFFGQTQTLCKIIETRGLEEGINELENFGYEFKSADINKLADFIQHKNIYDFWQVLKFLAQASEKQFQFNIANLEDYLKCAEFSNFLTIAYEFKQEFSGEIFASPEILKILIAINFNIEKYRKIDKIINNILFKEFLANYYDTLILSSPDVENRIENLGFLIQETDILKYQKSVNFFILIIEFIEKKEENKNLLKDILTNTNLLNLTSSGGELGDNYIQVFERILTSPEPLKKLQETVDIFYSEDRDEAEKRLYFADANLNGYLEDSISPAKVYTINGHPLQHYQKDLPNMIIGPEEFITQYKGDWAKVEYIPFCKLKPMYKRKALEDVLRRAIEQGHDVEKKKKRVLAQ